MNAFEAYDAMMEDDTTFKRRRFIELFSLEYKEFNNGQYADDLPFSVYEAYIQLRLPTQEKILKLAMNVIERCREENPHVEGK